MSLTYIKVIVSTRFNISIRISCTETALHSANARKILKKNTNKEVKTKKIHLESNLASIRDYAYDEY